MGGAHIALKPDSTSPVFVNTGNPASYALIRFTTLEVGGRFFLSSHKSKNSGLNIWNTGFGYGTLGFPVRNNGGMCLGIMPYTFVGYQTSSTASEPIVGNIKYQFNGDGGLSKAFVGYGIMPFHKRLIRFKRKYLNPPDSAKHLGRLAYKLREFNSKWLSDLTIGANANYIFGNISNSTRVIYPNSLLYNNTFRERTLVMGDFTGNIGVQTAFTADSVKDYRGHKKKIEAEIKKIKAYGHATDSSALSGLSPFKEDVIEFKADSIKKNTPLHRRALREKVKLSVGFFMSLNNNMAAKYTSAAYNYIVNGQGEEIIRDTAYYLANKSGSIRLPLEQGFGLGLKKGERWSFAADFALTAWSGFKYLNEISTLKDNYRIAAGVNYVPEKYAFGKGSYFSRVNYRFGVNYNTGYVNLNNTTLADYSINAGIGLPVGTSRYNSSMVNVSLQYGQMGFNSSNAIKENYFRVGFGFTYCDRWFQKFRYD